MDEIQNNLRVYFSEHTKWDANSGKNSEPILLSIVSPAYNEAENIVHFCEKVSEVLESMNISWEIIFVNDGSTDDSAEIMRQMNDRDARIKSVIFARNFGNQVAISAGLRASRGRAVIVMDADLQQPPEMIPQMVALWKQGFHVVNMVRISYDENAGWFKKKTSAWFYKFMNYVSEIRVEPNSSEFRLMDRTVVDILCRMPERTRFLRGLVRWLGFRQTSIPCEIHARFAGVPSFTPRKLLALALDGIVSFSTKPLRWIVYMGAFFLFLLIPWGAWDAGRCVFCGGTPNLASFLVPLNLAMGGTILLALGILGEYVGRIYTEAKQRPLFTVQQQFGLDEVQFEQQTMVGHSWCDATQFESEIDVKNASERTEGDVSCLNSNNISKTIVRNSSANPSASDVLNGSGDLHGSNVLHASNVLHGSNVLHSSDVLLDSDGLQNSARSQGAA